MMIFVSYRYLPLSMRQASYCLYFFGLLSKQLALPTPLHNIFLYQPYQNAALTWLNPTLAFLHIRANTTYNLPYQKDKCEIVFTNDFASCFYIIFLRKIQQKKLKHELEITHTVILQYFNIKE